MITPDQLLDKFNNMSIPQHCFMLAELYRNFVFVAERQSGKSTFLSKFVLLDALNNGRSSLYIIVDEGYKLYILERLVNYIATLHISDSVESKFDNGITFKNGSSILISTNYDNKFYDNIVIDNAEYYFGERPNIEIINSIIDNTNKKNNRLIISASYNGGGVVSRDFKDDYYTKFIKFMEHITIPIINMVEEQMILISRGVKIKKIQDKMKNH